MDSCIGVTAYALMAAGGDLGASICPQLIGAVVDGVGRSGWGSELAAQYGMSADQIGMKVGMLLTAVFPLLGIVAVSLAMRYFKQKKESV